MDPTCLAILLCDYVIEDKATNNKSLIGIFNRIHASAFPCQHARLVIFLSLTDGRGRTPVEVFIENADDRTETFKAEGSVDFKDPRQVVDLVFDLRGVKFDKPGAYFAGVRTAKGRTLAERRFNVDKVEGPAPPPQP